MDDLISRQAAISHLKKRLIETAINNTGLTAKCDDVFADIADNRVETWITELPSAQPERKGNPIIEDYGDGYYWECPQCHTLHRLEDGQRVEIRGIYDQEETIEGCTVQILRNSVTGEVSVGWWQGGKEDMPDGK